MKRLIWTVYLVVSGFLAGANQPNVLVILADDIGLGDISYYRRQHSDKIIVETPNIDKLAKEGMLFTNAHSPAALCAPSRYAIMTGNNPYRSYQPWGVWGAYERSPIEREDMTLGLLMKSAGYQTAFFGKWHIGGDWNRKSNPNEIYRSAKQHMELDVDISEYIGGGPRFQGFDYDFTYPAGIQDVPYAAYENGKWYPLHDKSEITFISKEAMLQKDVKLDKEEGLGDSHWDAHDMGPLLANKAVSYIDSHARQEQPFFMYYCSEAVHKPHSPPGSLNGVKIKGTTPSAHLDMVAELDQQIAMMVEALKRNGVYENTLIIFTSDNGGLRIPETVKSGHQSSDIYRGNKNTIFEGGHRVPFIACWPEKIKSGQKSNEPIQGNDIMATLAAINKQSLQEHQALDSYNLLPILNGEKDALGRDIMMIQGGTSAESALIRNDWKLVIQYKKNNAEHMRVPTALYHLATDIEESINLIQNPDQQTRIKEMLEQYSLLRNDPKRSTSIITN